MAQQTKQVMLTCTFCSNQFYRTASLAARHTYHFCDNKCAKQHRQQRPVVGEKKFELTFVSKHRDENNKLTYTCLCDCGAVISVSQGSWNTKKHCGDKNVHTPSHSQNYRGYKMLSMSYWSSVEKSALKRGFPFDITIEYAWELYVQQSGRCALSKVDINLDTRNRREQTASLDRIDSSQGYIPGNVQWVHKTVNRLKMELGDVEFVDWCTKISGAAGYFVNKLDFEDVLIVPQKTDIKSRRDVNLSHNTLSQLIPNVIPVIAANFDTVGSFAMAKELITHNVMTCIHKHYSTDQYVDFFNGLTSAERVHVFYSTGATLPDIEKLRQVAQRVDIPNVCLDVANAYIPQVLDTVASIREILPHCVLMVGNIATPEMIQTYANAGVDILKVGIGSGGVCVTRSVAGVGVPQLSAVLDCVAEAKRCGVKLCSDGGCKQPADVVKAFAAGADMVMIGSMFAGTDPCDGEWITHEGKKYLRFYGMSSTEAIEKHGGGLMEYRASEGKIVEIPHKGPIKPIVQQILGGIRSACTYTNSQTLAELSTNTTFIRVNRTLNESLSQYNV